MPNRRSARIACLGGSFWVTPKLFWRWVREGLVEFEAERPALRQIQRPSR